MKHGVRFWEKKLNRTPTHRASLLSNLLGQLIQHEKIETTVAKAKFLKHEMEKIITLAKVGGDTNWQLIATKVNNSQISLPKLKHILLNRYKDRRGGYVRILRNGFRASGSDRSSLAIIELVNNPNDTIYHLAQKQLGPVSNQLLEVETKKYERKPLVLKNLQTGKEETIYKIRDKANLSAFEKKRLSRAEAAIHKKLLKFNKSVKTYPIAREVDDQSVQELQKLVKEFESLNAAEAFVPAPEVVDQCLPAPAKKIVLTKSSTDSPTDIIVQPEVEAKPAVEQPPKSFREKFFGRLFK